MSGSSSASGSRPDVSGSSSASGSRPQQTADKRVLVVDDSVVVRKLLTEVIDAEQGLRVVATAPNGRIALAKLPQVNPDLVILDVEMPELDGLATLKRLRESNPRLPVIMFSTVTERGGRITMEALLSGANDYVAKPSNASGVSAGIAAVRADLVPKIRALLGVVRSRGATARAVPVPVPAPARSAAQRVDVVAIGVSTGGPKALQRLFADLPADLPAPVLVVQHMPPTFTRLLAETLDAVSRLQVAEATPGVHLRPGQAWIAAGGHHLAVRRTAAGAVLALDDGPPECSCRPSVDVLLRSVAEAYGPAGLALVLTGMGHDGLRGAEAVVAVGGSVLVQDQASSVVWGMPGAVAAAGLADRVVPLDGMAEAISARLRVGRSSVTRVSA